MELELLRTYHPNGTNGCLMHGSNKICYTIELPWKQNQARVSCIPEGKYAIMKRYNQRFGNHFMVTGVPERSLILIHPANDALLELKGCIAPVSLLTGEGRGEHARIALKTLTDYLYPFMETEQILINIKKLQDEHDTKGQIAHTRLL